MTTPVSSLTGNNSTPNLMPVAMKIAAQTIGLDLVSVKPLSAPLGNLMYIDFWEDIELPSWLMDILKIKKLKDGWYKVEDKKVFALFEKYVSYNRDKKKIKITSYNEKAIKVLDRKMKMKRLRSKH